MQTYTERLKNPVPSIAALANVIAVIRGQGEATEDDVKEAIKFRLLLANEGWFLSKHRPRSEPKAITYEIANLNPTTDVGEDTGLDPECFFCGELQPSHRWAQAQTVHRKNCLWVRAYTFWQRDKDNPRWKVPDKPT